MSESKDTQDYRAFVAKPGDMDPQERANLSRTLPQYLTRGQAAELAAVHERTIDRWRRWWTSSGTVGLKTYYARATSHDMSEQPPGDVRVSKVQLLERIGFDPDAFPGAPKVVKPQTIAEAAAQMLGGGA